MKRTILSVLAVSAALLFTACGESEPRLDTSSESAFAESMEIMLKKLSPEEQTIVDALSGGQRLVDDVIAETGLSTGKLLSSLTMLELKGIIKRLPGKRIVLSGK